MKTITVKELKKVLNQTLAEERALDVLREETTRNLGPSVITEVKLDQLAENINDRMDVLERTGRELRQGFRPATLLRFANNPNPEVRRLVVRLLPEKFARNFITDRDPYVRHAAAKRVPLSLVKEMLRRSPGDDELHVIYRSRRLGEAAEVSIGERLKGNVKVPNSPELSDFTYQLLAQKAISDYNSNIEGQWDEPFVVRYCASVKATTGIQYEPARLWKAIQQRLTDRDDRVLERNSLKESRVSYNELGEDDAYEQVDPVTELVESNISSHEYVTRANRLFSIRESIMPAGLRKYRMTEGLSGDIMIPCTGKLPFGMGMTPKTERALDMYVNKWNDVQSRRGEPVRIGWTPNTMSIGSFSFNVELK
jgi:hypothetical protein